MSNLINLVENIKLESREKAEKDKGFEIYLWIEMYDL